MRTAKSGTSFCVRLAFHVVASTLACSSTVVEIEAATFYIDAETGDDTASGTSPDAAWASLEKASSRRYKRGDRILLRRGQAFAGKLKLSQSRGSVEEPIVVGGYGESARPRIDAAGYLAGLQLSACSHVEVRDLEISADGGAPVDGSDAKERYGVLATTYGERASRGLVLRNLRIHSIYPHEATEHEGRNPTTHLGKAIRISGSKQHPYRDIRIEGCQIENTGHAALHAIRTRDLRVLDNRMEDIGGPAMVPSHSEDLIVRGNTVDHSGAFTDKRMHGRGSGIWPVHCERVLIEHNRFMHARGRYDSCGAHIDIGNRNVVIQYNLSLDNEGGFVEILGENSNCAYRYNVSVNDGARVANKAKKQGTGHVILFSGHNGTSERSGPTHCYVYNNTIFVRRGQRASFSIEDTTGSVLVANNLFVFQGKAENGTPSWWAKYQPGIERRVVWKNNGYRRRGGFPADWPFRETSPIMGNPYLAEAGSDEPEGYRPGPKSIAKDRGVEITKLPGDEIGLEIGLAVEQDFFGAPIVGRPDLGAIELVSHADPAAGEKTATVTITDRRERSLEARILHVDESHVYVRLSTGRNCAIPLTQLDNRSNALVAAWREKHESPLTPQQARYLQSLRKSAR